jgi:hypothetical protein
MTRQLDSVTAIEIREAAETSGWTVTTVPRSLIMVLTRSEPTHCIEITFDIRGRLVRARIDNHLMTDTDKRGKILSTLRMSNVDTANVVSLPTNPTVHEITLTNHYGTFTTDSETMDRAITVLLPSSPSRLRELCERHMVQPAGTYANARTVTECLIMLCHAGYFARQGSPSEYQRPRLVKPIPCRCGEYLADDQQDLADHVDAMMSIADGSHHGEK